MAFHPDYQATGSQREQVAGFGNAVTPPAAEVLVSALVEAITGEPLPRPGHPA
jgi:DNA (cytosine-5)-methyltransferase 1